ncbi:MAG: hypothetical protein BYD32DRAFT_428945 [Podila humilis]|nr:MAG: hypothetical protein BYD32DRAFT_428945 [Podila humilis]
MRLLIQSRGLHIRPTLFFSLPSIFFRSSSYRCPVYITANQNMAWTRSDCVCVCVMF